MNIAQDLYLHDEQNSNHQIFDLIGELLTLALSQYEVEVIIDSSESYYNSIEGIETTGLLKTTIDAENIVMTKKQLDLTLSGRVENQLGQKKEFTLFVLMNFNEPMISSQQQLSGYGFEANSLHIAFVKKAEQLMDSVFKLKLCRPTSGYALQVFAKGKGFLVFGRERITLAN